MIDIRFSEPQAFAVIETLADGQPPSDGRSRAALERARGRLIAALDNRRVIPEHAHDCDALSDALSAVGSAEFVALAARRVRDLIQVAELWVAVERAGRVGARARLLRVEVVDEAWWRADVLDELEAVGVVWSSEV